MKRSFIYIFIGAALWGTIGWFVKHLNSFGFSSLDIVIMRVVIAAIILIIYLGLTAPYHLKIKEISDVKYYIGTGIFSFAFFNYCMFKAIELSTIPVANALLYTAPAFVIILSVIFLNESITKIKISSLIFTLTATTCVAGLITINWDILHLPSLLFGLGSGLGYALYSIFSKFALKKYSSINITTYTFLFASLILIGFFPFQNKGTLLLDPVVLFYVIGLGVFPTALAYIIYTVGLSKTE